MITSHEESLAVLNSRFSDALTASPQLPGSVQGCIHQAVRYLQAGDLSKVRDWLERALDIAPDDPVLLETMRELDGRLDGSDSSRRIQDGIPKIDTQRKSSRSNSAQLPSASYPENESASGAPAKPSPTTSFNETKTEIDRELRDVHDNWNEFGKRDPLWAILTADSKRDGKWDLAEFFATGEREINGVITNFESLNHSFGRGKALDFGCGVGRLTQALCRHFVECHGIDIAESMVEQAREYNRFGDRCQYHVNTKPDLSLFANDTFDFVYTNIVLQHNPPAMSRRFIQEFLRILKPGGLLAFQLPSEPIQFTSGEGRAMKPEAFKAQLSVSGAETQWLAGAAKTIYITVKNISTVTWPGKAVSGKLAVRLGNHWRDAKDRVIINDDARADLPHDLKPGEEITLPLSVSIPGATGQYRLELDMVQEAVAWFADKRSQTLLMNVDVAPNPQSKTPAKPDSMKELDGFFENRPATQSTPEPAPANSQVLVPRMEMNGIPKAEVIKLLERCGGRIIDITDDNAASGWLGFRYCVTKPELRAVISNQLAESCVQQSRPGSPSAAEMDCYVKAREHVGHAEFVALAYHDILGRGLDEAGYSNWLTKLNEGFDRCKLVESFANSAEAQARENASQPLHLPVFDRATPPPVPPRSSLEQYQDVWVRGSVKAKGVRQCADRFELIRKFCAQYKRPFTVLDLGCNLGYFSLRLAETFDCTVAAAEGIYGEWTEEVLRENGRTRVILLKKVFTLADLRALAAVEHFDVILALSVVHHLDGTFDESLEVLRSLGDHLILELPFEENACGPAIVQQAVAAQLPAEAQLMGYGKSHLAEGERPFYSLSRPKTQLLKSYLGTPRTGLQLTVHSSFTEKRAEFANKSETRAWHRGINLQTYLWFNGVWPARQDIAQMVQGQGLAGKTHRDIQPWNVLLQGDAVQFIDYDDPNHAFAYDDSEYRDRLVKLLMAGVPANAELVAGLVPLRRMKMPVRWAGPIFNPSGYASEAINFLLPLSQRVTLGLYHHNNIYSEAFVAGLQKPDRESLFALRDEFENLSGGVGISHNPANGFMRIPNAEYHVGRTMFETDRISPDWVAACNQMDEVWVPSQFNVETFAASGVERDKLFVMPEAVDEQAFDPARHTPLPLANRAAFNFLSIFEWSSRKGWDVLLSAYLREFSAEDDVCLYLRTYLFSRPDGDPSEAIWRLIRDHAATLGLGDKKLPRIELIANQVPLADLPRLYLAADCLVAPSRGEGWGRPHHEAMMMGLPVIATNWSGNTEFMTGENSYLLDYELVDINQVELELWHYRGHRWANPSESHLRALMRRVQHNPAEARERGSRARAHMLKHFSRIPVADQVVRRLQAIEQKVTVPSCPATETRITSIAPEAPDQKHPTIHVAWEGTFLDLGSLSHVNREITGELANLPGVKLVRVGKNVLPANPAPWPGMQETARRLVALPPKQTQVTVRHSWPPSWDRPATGAWVLVQPWEFGALPAEWVKQLARVDEVWAPSEYVRRVYVESGVAPQKVKVVPNGIDPARFHPNAAPLKLATNKSFKFLFVGGTIHRKGPDLLLKTFLQSFTAADDVCLVIKDFGGQSVYAGQTFEAQIKAAQAQPNAPEILYLNEELSPESLPGLYTACDCLVHPYRGEGFGLPVLEAMACGLPVVVTGGGATDDFATDEFAYRLPALRKDFCDSISGLKLVKPGWLLEPDTNALAERLKWIVTHQAEARAKGTAASDYVRREWTWARAAKIAGQHLQRLVTPRETASTLPSLAPKALTLPPVARFGNLAGERELLSQGKVLEAWNETISVLSVRPYHPEAFLLLAEIARAAGDHPRAKELAEYSRKLAPKWKPAQLFLKSPATKNAIKIELPPLADSFLTPRVSRLTVCLITKNEERFLGQCLESVRDMAGQIVVMDTGSTDRTVEIARQHGAEVYSFAWSDDFSAARNAALERATGDWILVLDADEELLPDQREKLRKLVQDPSAMAFRLPMIDKGREEEGVSYLPRLFRNAPGLFFIGCVHEHVFLSVEARRQEWGLGNKLGDATLLHHGYTAEVMESRGKSARNLKLLQKALLESPDDPNLLMNLGLELARAGRLPDGIDQYDAAFRALSALPSAEVVPEFCETLLTQFCTHLVTVKDYARVARVVRSPLARASGLTATLHWLFGLACIESQNFAEGAEQMRQCLAKRNKAALSPVNRNILRGGPNHCLAMCLIALNQFAEAEQALRAALVDEPGSVGVRFELARLWVSQGRPVDALTLLHQMISENASDARIWLFGGQIALSQPELLEFAADWTGEAVKHFPQDREIALQRAEALLLSGKMEQAHPLFRLHLDQGNWRILAAIALIELIVDGTEPGLLVKDQTAVGREFVQWYRRLLAYDAGPIIEQVNVRLPQLRAILPSAAAALEAALADAVA